VLEVVAESAEGLDIGHGGVVSCRWSVVSRPGRHGDLGVESRRAGVEAATVGQLSALCFARNVSREAFPARSLAQPEADAEPYAMFHVKHRAGFVIAQGGRIVKGGVKLRRLVEWGRERVEAII
jgi:hypothetical protein